ncbi:unnamed protein product, partial [Echinostoma caproni]|uniref:Ig-like domain-containing protein n=1 Tax=Echinostoma caproni TaxID=27848 RepID=A0A183B6E7_9TREM
AVPISFVPERAVFWQHENLTCISHATDQRFQPYLVIVDHPDNFRPQLNYSVLQFHDLPPGQYEYVNSAGLTAMRCLENGYPKSEITVTWTVPDTVWCCEQHGNELVISPQAIYGQYAVKCQAILQHPLMTLNLSLETRFGAIGPVFVAERKFAPYQMQRTVTKVLLQLLWAAAYLILTIAMSQLVVLREEPEILDESVSDL